GSAGLNSFRTFDVGAGATVNLHLPSGAGSLVNIVTGGRRSFIDGTVHAPREGRIGGNVYFLNPDGIVVGPDGVINAGALALLTPTREFVDGFFAGGAAGTAAAVSRVLDGAVPVDPAGLISVRGQVRTAGDVDVRAGSVGITGEIRTGTVFVGQQPQAGLGDVINIGGIPVPAGEITEAGHIRIVAEGDVQQAGALHADGDDGQAAGRIFITAGGDVVIEHGSVASAQGPAPSSGAGVQAMSVPGPGGGDATVALRAGGTLVLGGGTVASSSAGGPVVMSAGSIVIDADPLSGGEDVELSAEDSITVAPGVTVSSRQIAGGDHADAASTGSSGNIRLSAPFIAIASNARLLAHATGGHAAGAIELIAEDVDDSGLGELGLPGASAAAKIVIEGGALLKGGDISLRASAQAQDQWDVTAARQLVSNIADAFDLE